MIFLNKRQIDIIKYLKDMEEWITIKNISDKFYVSERTIRNDLDLINQILLKEDMKIEKKPKIGVKMNVENHIALDRIINSCKNKIYTCLQRANIVSCILLIKENTKIEDLAKELEVSKNTLFNDLKYSEDILNKYKIKLIKETYKGLRIEESYKNILDAFLKIYKSLDDIERKKVDELLFKYSKLKSIQIKRFIEKLEEDKSINFTYEFTLEIELIIMFSACKDYKKYEFIEDEKIKNLDKFIKENLNINLNYEILKYLSIIIYNTKKIQYENDILESDISKITEDIINEMFRMLSIEKNFSEEFINQMKMHINIAIHRVRNNLIIENPMLEETKYKMPFIFEITETILKNKKDIIGLEFPEEEIAFIAMYFGILFERHLKQSIKINVLIVCNGGLATSTLLKSRISIMMPELNIKGVCSIREIEKYLNNYKDIDFIISTVFIDLDNYNVIKVSPLLEMIDCEKITSAIYNKWKEKNFKYLINKFDKNQKKVLKNIIGKEYAQFNINIKDWREAIREATKCLVYNKKVKEDYAKDIIEVIEKLGNYMVFIPEIAFVHASAENVIENSVSYLNLSSRILFGSKNQVPVKTIVVLANKTQNKNLIHIINILEKKDNIKIFKNAKSYDDLYNLEGGDFYDSKSYG